MPAISVIIPSYNHARYIEEAITSVLQQSFTDFELIIIDDNSQDTSWNVINNFDDPRITALLHIHNQGAAQTINEGLLLAKGDYLTILNSDDSYHPDRLKKLYSLKKDFVATDLYLCDEHSNSKESFEPDWISWFESLKEDYKKTNDFIATLLKGNFLITTSNFFFSQKLYQQLEGFKDLRYVHDYEFAIAALFSDFQVAYCQEKLLNYRLHGSNTIREAPLKAIQENMNLLLSLLEKFSSELAEKPKYLSSLSQHLNELYQFNNNEWKTKLHHKLVDKELQLFRLIQDRDTWISERNNWIHERDEHINEQNQWLNKQDISIERLNHQIRENTTICSKQKQWITDRDGWINERNELITKQQSWITDRDDWVNERDQIIQQLQEEIQALRESRSYRFGQAVFSPMQPLKKIIKGEEYA